MTNVKELREWLKQFPDETEVCFAVQSAAGAYQSYGSVEFISPELTNDEVGNGWEYIDFGNNRFVKSNDARYGKTYLHLGESD